MRTKGSPRGYIITCCKNALWRNTIIELFSEVISYIGTQDTYESENLRRMFSVIFYFPRDWTTHDNFLSAKFFVTLKLSHFKNVFFKFIEKDYTL